MSQLPIKSLYTHASENILKTWVLMSVFLITFIMIGFVFSHIYTNTTILYIFVLVSIVMNIVSYFYSDRIALSQSGAQEADSIQYIELHRIVENLSITAGLPKPRVYIINDASPNAFATGRDPQHAAIAVTTGLLSLLDKTELEGVIAHEMSHIGNRDILIASVVVVLVGIVSITADMLMRGFIFGRNNDQEDSNPLGLIITLAVGILSPLLATIVQLAISRKREFLADASGAILTRYPEGLARALQKIEKSHIPLQSASNATAHLYISNPFKNLHNGFLKLFATHPPTQERVKALVGE